MENKTASLHFTFWSFLLFGFANETPELDVRQRLIESSNSWSLLRCLTTRRASPRPLTTGDAWPQDTDQRTQSPTRSERTTTSLDPSTTNDKAIPISPNPSKISPLYPPTWHAAHHSHHHRHTHTHMTQNRATHRSRCAVCDPSTLIFENMSILGGTRW
jgi:hypothetical protein